MWLGLYPDNVARVRIPTVTVMKFSEVIAKDATKNQASAKIRLVSYLGAEANGRVHVYHAERKNAQGEVIAEGTLKGYDLPPASLELADADGTLDAQYRVSSDNKWIIDANRGAELKSFEGLVRK